MLHSQPLFDRTVYFVPGNHDHHLWEGAREAHYAKSVRSSDKSQQRTLDPPRHATHLIAATDKDPWTAPLLEALIHREPELRDVRCTRSIPTSRSWTTNGTRAVVFHHGHYAESLYRLVSTITGMMFPDRKKPEEVHEWEAENFAWVDFFWSTLGRSGGAGDDVGLAYDYLQSEAATEYLVTNLVDGFGRHSDHALVRRFTPLLEPALKRVTHHVRRHASVDMQSECSARTPKPGCAEYVEGPAPPAARQSVQRRHSRARDVPLRAHPQAIRREHARTRGTAIGSRSPTPAGGWSTPSTRVRSTVPRSSCSTRTSTGCPLKMYSQEAGAPAVPGRGQGDSEHGR